MLRKIKELASKPSNAVQAMIDGLFEQSKREDFKVSMGSFGSTIKWSDGITCYGCAATCTIQKMAGRNLQESEIENVTLRSHFLSISTDELREFECVIDKFRYGSPRPLLEYYDVGEDLIREIIKKVSLPPLSTRNWMKRIDTYQEFVNTLRDLNL